MVPSNSRYPRFSAVLLAGGKSERMGRDKALLPLTDGRLLWQRQVDLLASLQPEKIFFSGPARPGLPPDIEVVLDDHPGSGPLGGLTAALRKCPSPLLLLLAVDLPCMTDEFLGCLLAESSDEKGVVCRGEFYEPLAALYPSSALALAEARLAEGAYAMKHLIEDLVCQDRMKVRPLASEESGLFENWNTPEDAGLPRS